MWLILALFLGKLKKSLCFSSLPGKAPPNLAQGVPPLLANQYIMGPGGLLPAYPVTIPCPNHLFTCLYIN